MCRRSASPRPLPGWIALGLLTVVAGCVASAGSLPSPAPTTTAAPSATTLATATTQPTSAPTLPATALRPSPSATLAPTATPPPASPEPTPAPTERLDPPPRPGPYTMNLYRRGDFASQVTKIYCVPGAMQTMMNVMDRGATKASRAVQDRLYRLARRLSTDRLRGQGAEPEGWARGLERLGYGKFDVKVANSRMGAIRAAARALRKTNRPVGLLVWRGAHAWVMTGFKASADPALTESFRITHVRIVDVWYPRVSSIWGASAKPNTLVPVEELDEDYLPWRRPLMRYPDKDRRFVLVAPVADLGAPDPIG
jgi:hypothetical protein